MSTQHHIKQSKRFGVNLHSFKKVTLKQQKNMQKTQLMKKKSNFAVQLDIRKGVAFLYGSLRAKYLTTLFQRSFQRKGNVSQNMVGFLEKRLDTLLVKNHFAPSFANARQLISHNKVRVNGVAVQVPSFQLQPGDVVTLKKADQGQLRQSVHAFLDQQEGQGALQKLHARKLQAALHSMVWYKTTHCEVNYKTLEIVLLFAPQQVHYPMQVHTEKFTKVFKK